MSVIGRKIDMIVCTTSKAICVLSASGWKPAMVPGLSLMLKGPWLKTYGIFVGIKR